MLNFRSSCAPPDRISRTGIGRSDLVDCGGGDAHLRPGIAGTGGRHHAIDFFFPERPDFVAPPGYGASVAEPAETTVADALGDGWFGEGQS